MTPCVLIIDDDEDLCQLLALYIRKKGFKTLRVNSLQEVEPFLQQEKPCLIFLDNNLEDGLGINFINKLKECCPGSTVILMTADHIHDLQGFDNFKSIDGLLLKPFAPASLNAILDKVAA